MIPDRVGYYIVADDRKYILPCWIERLYVLLKIYLINIQRYRKRFLYSKCKNDESHLVVDRKSQWDERTEIDYEMFVDVVDFAFVYQTKKYHELLEEKVK